MGKKGYILNEVKRTDLLILRYGSLSGLYRKPFEKGLITNPWQRLNLITLSPNPIRRDHNPFEKRLDRKVSDSAA